MILHRRFGHFAQPIFPMATSIIPPFAAFFMKALSFTLTDELLAAGESCAMATPAMLSDATIRGRTTKLRNHCYFTFHIFLHLNVPD